MWVRGEGPVIVVRLLSLYIILILRYEMYDCMEWKSIDYRIT